MDSFIKVVLQMHIVLLMLFWVVGTGQIYKKVTTFTSLALFVFLWLQTDFGAEGGGGGL